MPKKTTKKADNATISRATNGWAVRTWSEGNDYKETTFVFTTWEETAEFINDLFT